MIFKIGKVQGCRFRGLGLQCYTTYLQLEVQGCRLCGSGVGTTVRVPSMVSKHGRAQRQVKFECMEEPKGRSKSWKSPKAKNRNMAELTSRKKRKCTKIKMQAKADWSFLFSQKSKNPLARSCPGGKPVAGAYGCWIKWMPLEAKDLDQAWPQTWHVASWAAAGYGLFLAMLLDFVAGLVLAPLELGALGSHGLAGGALGCSWLAVGHHGCWDLELVAVAQWSLLGPRAAHTITCLQYDCAPSK